MELLGYLAAIFIGISLGLIGGGGSILTVPVLVYLFNINPTLATSYSLFVVGSTSFVGAITYYRSGLVSVRTALLFGLTSVITVFFIRHLIIPLIPKQLFTIGSLVVTKSMVTMVLFAALMLLASISMIRNKQLYIEENKRTGDIKVLKLMLYGIGIGLLTGILGVGGGFLIIPTLVLLLGLPMKKAVGTSLLIITLNTLVGFTGDLGHFPIDWPFLFRITAIAITGIFIGRVLSKKTSGEKLKTGFGWFILIIGIYTIIKELILK